MILPISVRADWDRIKNRKQEEIDRNNRRENRNRINHTYKEGDKIWLNKEGIQRKISAPRTGPYKITTVYNNGNLEVQTSDAVTERVTIRRVTPNFT